MKLKVSKCFVFVDLFLLTQAGGNKGLFGEVSGAPFTLWLARSNFKFVPAIRELLWPASIYLGLF